MVNAGKANVSVYLNIPAESLQSANAGLIIGFVRYILQWHMLLVKIWRKVLVRIIYSGRSTTKR
jgi:hypothetical protein